MISFASTARPSRGFMGSKGIGLGAGGHTPRKARPKGAELHERSEEASWVDRRRARSTTLPQREAKRDVRKGANAQEFPDRLGSGSA